MNIQNNEKCNENECNENECNENLKKDISEEVSEDIHNKADAIARQLLRPVGLGKQVRKGEQC
ncbi:MAG: hypothetical protein OXD33_09025 [Rhodobacteraceae bacterium]|nr:hypothetical protein [Paracoccaceae bacterium]